MGFVWLVPILNVVIPIQHPPMTYQKWVFQSIQKWWQQWVTAETERPWWVDQRVSGTGKTTPQLWCSRTPRNVGFHLLWITFCPWTKGGIPPGTSTSCSPELVAAQFWWDFLGGADFRDTYGNLEDLMYQNCWYTIMVYHGIRWYKMV